MSVSIENSWRHVLLLSVFFFALHCGTSTPPGDTDQAGGAAPSGGGLGGDDGAASDGATPEGSGGMGGTVGDDGSVTSLSLRSIDKVDVLFVVDNSVSMADKQVLLVQAVPKLIARLVSPDCIDLTSGSRTPSHGLACPIGSALEMEPVDDLHIGVISSSLGSFGTAGMCASGDAVDRSRFIPKIRAGTPDPNGLGFLEWTGGAEEAIADLNANFAAQIDAVGEVGCGFEAPLEAWYRFLIDPSPPEGLAIDASMAVSTGVDQAILQQRSQFLRPDSLVAIVMLTDEDDCSGMEGGGYYPYAGYGWLITDTNRRFETASEACATNPNDACCYSCLLRTAPTGCNDTCVRDANETGAKLSVEEDRANLRCHQAKRRFGIDLLYPTRRYIDGLSQTTIVDTQQTTDADEPVLVPNPLLLGASLDEAERSARPPGHVFLAGIVGVPWQDIATSATLEHPDALEYLTARELAEPDAALDGEDRWALILGRPGLPALSPPCKGESPADTCGEAPIAPLDPFMIESIEPRSGTNPITGDAIVPIGGDAWSPINGSEYDNSVDVGSGPANDDLQYACIFPLSESSFKPSCDPTDHSCDCGTEPDKERPLCKPPGSVASSPATTTQYWGKAYPAKRILQVLQGFGENSIVASICPKNMHQPNSPSFGYGPALAAITRRLAGTRGAACLAQDIPWNDDLGACAVVEASPVSLDCSRDGRADLDEELLPSTLGFLEREGYCSDDSEVPCEDYGLCAITPVDDRAPCFGATAADDQPAGYCFIDPTEGPAAGGEGEDCSEDPSTWTSCENPNAAICPESEGRMLRFVGPSTPEPGALVFRVCAE